MVARMTQIEKQVAQLEKLHKHLVNHRNAYYNTVCKGLSMSTRMYNWVDTYNDMRGTPAWTAFCKKNGFDAQHDAFDNFA
jgi:hypothetical protein